MTHRFEVGQTFRSALGLDEEVEIEDLVYRGIEEWDSVAHMVLVAELEDRFDVMLSTDDVLDMSSFSKALEILSRHGIIIE
jgi:acyl carrier protein